MGSNSNIHWKTPDRVIAVHRIGTEVNDGRAGFRFGNGREPRSIRLDYQNGVRAGKQRMRIVSRVQRVSSWKVHEVARASLDDRDSRRLGEFDQFAYRLRPHPERRRYYQRIARLGQ